MRSLQFACLGAAFSIAAAYQIISGKTMSTASPEGTAEVEIGSALSSNFVTSALPVPHGPLPLPQEETSSSTLEKEQARLEAAVDALEQLARTEDSVQDHSTDAAPPKPTFLYLAYYAFSEIPPDEKPADTILETMKGLPIGTPVEEIRRASDAFGLDFNFMKAVARIESGFDPKQRTGSYLGLFQLSKYEFNKFGSGQILDPRDNAIAAAYKVITEGILFEWMTHKKPTLSDLYLIHQQGWEGAAEHISQPDRIAWRSMCATSQGMEKGEKWGKRAIWRNTLPAIKHAWKSVDKLTSGPFVGIWRERVADFYSQYIPADER